MTYSSTNRTSPAAAPRERARRRHGAACLQLIATSALIVSLAVALTVVSIGIGRASVPPASVTQTTR